MEEEAQSSVRDQVSSLLRQRENVVSRNEQYTIQYFACTAESYTNEVYDIIQKNFYETFMEYHDRFREEFSEIITNEELNEGHDIFSNAFLNHVLVVCDKLELYLTKNMLHIPSNILLPEDSIHQKTHLTISEEELDKEIDEKINKLKAIKCANASLEQKICDQKMIQEEHKKLIELQENLQKKYKENTFLTKDIFSNIGEQTKKTLKHLIEVQKFIHKNL